MRAFFSTDYGRILIGLTFFCILATIPFWIWPIDTDLAGRYYNNGEGRSFPLKYAPFWHFIYELIPVMSGLVLVGTLLFIGLSYLKPSMASWRRPTLVVLLAFVIGPGVLVNAIFKEHWGRPRPAQLEQFGGEYDYVKPWQFGGYDNAKSFPSGHASVGFAFMVFWLLWRRRYPLAGKASLAFALGLGSLAGAARIVGGGHFLSDVLWAMYMSTMPGFFLYYWLVDGKTERSQPGTAGQKKLAVIGLSVLGAASVVYMLVSIPFNQTHERYYGFDTPKAITVKPYGARVTVRYDKQLVQPYMHAELEGYGFEPMIEWHADAEPVAPAHQKITLQTRGWFTEMHQKAVLHLPASYRDNVSVDVLPRSRD
ncbi:Uncharacterised protein [BD1-7 clade bacterium]|uniref:Phosphatidic acid phosphatase type 2/haloperoxidase domain-containing protein n=1 Tax=BD1-7 clade bacterium TaxID=2029982 RepID=A0A5S9QBU5_9GAMM|nr:Uncharacterised protein [BD1-7 clade bacterium]CAA0114924.1 Uncharacterised protein [BD1-7 clade bacterium]